MTPRATLALPLRQMREPDVDAVLALERLCFASIPEERRLSGRQVRAHVRVFPEGQWVVEDKGEVVASCLNMRTTWSKATRQHRWREVTGDGLLTTHDPDGDVLYGNEIMVHPRARRLGLGRRLFERRFAYVVEHGLRAFVTGGRLPGYARHADRMVPQEYVEAVQRGDLTDPVLTPELKWGLTPMGVLAGYLMDPDSWHYATLVVWENPARD